VSAAEVVEHASHPDHHCGDEDDDAENDEHDTPPYLSIPSQIQRLTHVKPVGLAGASNNCWPTRRFDAAGRYTGRQTPRAVDHARCTHQFAVPQATPPVSLLQSWSLTITMRRRIGGCLCRMSSPKPAASGPLPTAEFCCSAS
jgi:hypothetical protein